MTLQSSYSLNPKKPSNKRTWKHFVKYEEPLRTPQEAQLHSYQRKRSPSDDKYNEHWTISPPDESTYWLYLQHSPAPIMFFHLLLFTMLFSFISIKNDTNFQIKRQQPQQQHKYKREGKNPVHLVFSQELLCISQPSSQHTFSHVFLKNKNFFCDKFILDFLLSNFFYKYNVHVGEQ